MQAAISEWLKADAELAHEMYPQYRNHWDGWSVGVMRRRVETKMGVAFEAGDLVLVKPRDSYHFRITTFEDTAYSWRNGIDTRVSITDVIRFD
jgi:hypothetical protein